MTAGTGQTFAQPISERLRGLVEGERADIDGASRQAVQTIQALVPDYALSSDPQMLQDLYRSAHVNAQLWFDALLQRQSLSTAALEPVVQFARSRVHQGISLSGLLRAFRVIARSFWARLLQAAGDDAALHSELLCKVSPYLLQHFDIVAEAIADAYLKEQAQHARWRDRLRQELWMIVSGRTEDASGFRARAEALGIAPASAHCALVLRWATDSTAGSEQGSEPVLADLARRFGTAHELLMRAPHRDHLVAWVAVPRDTSLIAFDQQLAQAAAALVEAGHGLRAVGIGLPGVAAQGWRVSMEQGFRALGSGGAPERRVHRFSQIVLDDAVSVSENVSGFMGAMMETLAAETALLETLRAYIQHRQHRKATAAALNVHPNTLDHRLERIETLLDGRFDDIDWLARIHTALRLFRPASR